MKTKNSKKIAFFALAVFLLVILPQALAFQQASFSENKVTIYFFWGEGCPRCNDQKPFLEEIQSKYSQVEVKSIEVWRNPEKIPIFEEAGRLFGVRVGGVPHTFIGDKDWVGFADQYKAPMEAQIVKCIEQGCPDKLSGLFNENNDVPVGNDSPAENNGYGALFMLGLAVIFGLVVLGLVFFVMKKGKPEKTKKVK